MFKCILGKGELQIEYVGLYTNGKMIIVTMYGQISYNCWLSKAFKLKLGHNRKLFLVEIQRVTVMEIAEHVS
jgi:hypothetical protein